MHIDLVKAAFGGVERLLSSFLSVMKTQEEEDGGREGGGCQWPEILRICVPNDK